MRNRFEIIARMIAEAEQRAKLAGISPRVYASHLIALEAACCKALVEQARQIDELCEQIGVMATAERLRVTRQALWKRRKRARGVSTDTAP